MPSAQAVPNDAIMPRLPARVTCRSLLGEEVFYMPASELGRRHLQRAMAMAATMDVLLVGDTVRMPHVRTNVV